MGRIKNQVISGYISWFDLTIILCIYNQDTLASVFSLYLKLSLFAKVPIYFDNTQSLHINKYVIPEEVEKRLQHFIDYSTFADVVLSENVYNELDKKDKEQINSLLGIVKTRYKLKTDEFCYQTLYYTFKKADLKTLPYLQDFLPSDFYNDLGLNNEPTPKLKLQASITELEQTPYNNEQQQIADLQAENARLQARIAELENEFNDTFQSRQGVGKAKILAKEVAKHVAKKLWEEDKDKKIKVTEMAIAVYVELQKCYLADQLTDQAVGLKDWIRDIAPEYARKGGRPKNEP